MAKFASAIRERIATYPAGTIFSGSDLAEIAEAETRRRILNRLVEDGTIHRVIDGLYEKPKFSPLLQEYVAPSPADIASALARTKHWTIAPSGNTALNLLGLSTQVPATWSYISDGPYVKYTYGNTILEFKHRTNKEITGLSPTTALVIQALKALGKNGANQGVIDHLRGRLSPDERALLLREGKDATSWIYSAIKKVCEGEVLS